MSPADFWQAIRESPDDDTPRLVFADWLEEHGDDHSRARAEFIRLQIEAARAPEEDPYFRPRQERIEQLRQEHERAWLGVAGQPSSDPDRPASVQWKRGFVSLLRSGSTTFDPLGR